MINKENLEKMIQDIIDTAEQKNITNNDMRMLKNKMNFYSKLLNNDKLLIMYGVIKFNNELRAIKKALGDIP